MINKETLMRPEKVICGFPGIGKSWLTENQERLNISISDSDSSKFSWIKPGERNPEFPNNYINHIKNIVTMYDFVLVSSHVSVRNALRDHNIPYTVIHPKLIDKDEYIKRFKQRGSPSPFIDLIQTNWDEWIAEIITLEPTAIELPEKWHLNDYLNPFFNID